ncbi:MAG: radical SAM family heme chaperone HemW, partial [Propionibacteriaceae bacterium]|nr:radical SAM family heme chaperone HemW [Propionibacteriaceae bacterium]
MTGVGQPELVHGETAPLSFYIHIPWCRARCGYCDFNTYVTDTGDVAIVDGYLSALLAEIDQAAQLLGPRRLSTIYFGGGTPTLMPTAGFGRLINAIAQRFELDPDIEISSEANPETLSLGYLAALRQTGVNRLSLGMQSSDPAVLATLDRVHTPGRVAEAVRWARQSGFDNLSLDLIYGTPGESMSSWAATIKQALSLSPDHLSAYSLIVESGTPMARRIAKGELLEADEDELADKYLLAEECFAAAGLSNYEVSNWSRPGMACRHNLVYWRGGDWWGVGAGAHSYLA